MNLKIQKTITEIDKTKAKITELQTRLSELEAQRIDMENTEIVALFRSIDVAPGELAGFIRAYQTQASQPTRTSAVPSYHTQREEVSTNDEK